MESEYVKRPGDLITVVEAAAWSGLISTYNRVVRQLDAGLEATHGLSISAWEVLFFIEGAPDQKMRLSDLADSVLLTLSGMSRLVDRLQAEGLVCRETSTTDRRGTYAVLTDKGAGRLAEATQTHFAGVHSIFLDHFNTDEIALLAVFWQRFDPTLMTNLTRRLEPPHDTDEAQSSAEKN